MVRDPQIGMQRGTKPKRTLTVLFVNCMKTTCSTRNPVSRQNLPEDARLPLANRSIDVRGDPHPALPPHEFVAGVGLCLEQLASPQQEILKMCSGRDLSYEEISTRLKLSLDLVKTHIIRARENLRERLLHQQLFKPDGSVRGTLSVQA